MLVLLFAAGLLMQTPGIPRTADGKPNVEGIWKARSRAADDVGEIPYLPAAAAKKKENYANRQTGDPLAQCFMPGVPRIIYLDFPFQIFQTRDHVAITFEWSNVFRLIYTNGRARRESISGWATPGGTWEGDTLVADVSDFNDKTWFDSAGNFHSDKLHVTERYMMLDPDTIQYEVRIEDTGVFSKPWRISMPLVRQKQMTRILEYQCQAEAEEASGLFERDPHPWYPKQ